MKISDRLAQIHEELLKSGQDFATCAAMILREKAILYACENSPCDPITARLAIAKLGYIALGVEFQGVIKMVEDVLCYYSNIAMREPVLISLFDDLETMKAAYQEIPMGNRRT